MEPWRTPIVESSHGQIRIRGYDVTALNGMGFPPVFGRLLFIIGRVAGLSAEVMEELGRERPMRIRIPVGYDGEPPRPIGQG